MPVPITATLDAAVRKAPVWAAASMPAAMPLTMVSPACASASAQLSAVCAPCTLAWRLPTTASIGRCNNSRRPSKNNSGGGHGVFNKPEG